MAIMKAVMTQGDTVLSVQETARPTPGPGEILVKVHYAAQNPTDWKSARGSLGVVPPAPPGLISGCDFAGTVEDPNGSSWALGQRVAGFVQGTSRNGTPANPVRGAFAEYIPIEASLVSPVPDGVGLEGASTIGLAFATAVQALYQRLGLPEPGAEKTGEWFLVYGGATSVGNYAIQLAKLSGLRVVTTASPKNHEFLKELGADAVVDYHGDWAAEVRRITDGKLQSAIDTVAENGSTVEIAKALSQREGDHILTLVPQHPQAKEEIRAANPHARDEWTIVYTVFERAIPLKGYENCGRETPEDKKTWEKFLRLLTGFLERGEVKPNRARVLGGLESVVEGLKFAEEGKVSNEKLVYKVL
ncbi:zinc-binding oxidoreductase [Colletotrichum plurivorum]|uniref:Zinc-binding oxidoreductase n=1 Tax=Colletotrichum plurivorum TaxID=2175906 RepID=A0A8H6MZ64_9PEZI|nr:zinc-binding oxidoreductase [Colletotrichum plurivorum]